MSYFNKIELGSLSGSISTGSEEQLKVTPFSSDGVEGIKLINSYGEAIETHDDIDGEPYLGVTALQAVHADSNNSFTGSIAVGTTWSGSATSTLGVVGLQFSLIADQNCAVHFDQSPDGINWDVTDTFIYLHEQNGIHTGDGWTVQALNSYLRMRVQNIGTAETTIFRAQTALCPIAEPLPRALSPDGRLKTQNHLQDYQTARHGKISPTYELYTVERNRLVGKAFIGDIPDDNFWTGSEEEGGYFQIAGELQLFTGTSSSGSVQYQSVHKARFVAGMVNEFVSVARFAQPPGSGYKAQMGAYDENDGVFFIIDETNFGVGTRYSGSDDIVWNGSFNGTLGSTSGGNFELPNRYDIMYGGTAIEFYVGDQLIHTKYAVTEPVAFNVHFPITMEIENSGSTDDNAIYIRGIAVYRVGELNTSPVFTYSELAGDNRVLKRGAGKLHRVINTDNTGVVTLYDGLDNTGKIITTIDCFRILGSITYDVDFNIGLYMETSSPTNPTITVVYE